MLSNNAQVLMTGAAGKDTTVNVVFCNQGTTTARVSLAYVNGASITPVPNDSWLCFSETISLNSRLEIKGIVVQSGTTLAAMVESNSQIVSAITYGFEETTN